MRKFNNMRKEHEPYIKFRNNIPTVYDQKIKTYLWKSNDFTLFDFIILARIFLLTWVLERKIRS